MQFSLSLEKQHLLSVKTTVYVYVYSFIYGISDNIKKNSQFRFCKVHDTRHDMVLAPPAVRASLFEIHSLLYLRYFLSVKSCLVCSKKDLIFTSIKHLN